MGIPSHIVECIAGVQNLSPDNFAEHVPIMEEFFTAAGLSHVSQENEPGPLPSTTQKLDDEFSFILFSRVAPAHRSILAKSKGGRARWQKLVSSWTNSTFVDRVLKLDELLRIEHDPGQHITVFTEALDTLCTDLGKKNLTIADDVKTSILLARLHSSMAGTLHALCADATFPTFADAVARLRLDAHHARTYAHIKEEDREPILGAMLARIPRAPDGPAPPEAFRDGFRWCSPQSDQDCFRCGRPGHRAQLCMAVMPESVVQWILTATRSGRNSSAPASYTPDLAGPRKGQEAARIASAGVWEQEVDDDQDYGDWNIPWEILSPEQLKVFVEHNVRPPSTSTSPQASSSKSTEAKLRENLEARLRSEQAKEDQDLAEAIRMSLADLDGANSSSNFKGKAPAPAPVKNTTTSAAEIKKINDAFTTLSNEWSIPEQLDFSTSRTTSPVRGSGASDADSVMARLTYSAHNQSVRYYHQALSKLLARLDEVESFGDEEVRHARKEAVGKVESALDEVESVIEARWRKSVGRDRQLVADDVVLVDVASEEDPATSEQVVYPAPVVEERASQVVDQTSSRTGESAETILPYDVDATPAPASHIISEPEILPAAIEEPNKLKKASVEEEAESDWSKLDA
ncbi:BAG domain-containing protein [Mycena kentingensis (nom. inval.)]|nr:BAG domain-containing protein [Mycena kentingensis (nom. inval.)]